MPTYHCRLSARGRREIEPWWVESGGQLLAEPSSRLEETRNQVGFCNYDLARLGFEKMSPTDRPDEFTLTVPDERVHEWLGVLEYHGFRLLGKAGGYVQLRRLQYEALGGRALASNTRSLNGQRPDSLSDSSRLCFGVRQPFPLTRRSTRSTSSGSAGTS